MSINRILKRYLNNNNPIPKCQIKDKNPLLSVESELERVREYVAGASRGDLGIINTLLAHDLIHETIYTTQGRLGRTAAPGLVRETVCRRTTVLHENRIIHKQYRGIKKTCLYKVNRIFYRPEARNTLGKYLPILKKITLLLLLSVAEKPYLKGNVTQVVKKDIYTYNTSNLDSKEEPFYHKVRRKKQKNTRWEIIMSSITPLNRKISINVGATPYASLLLSVFPDDVLSRVYKTYLMNKKDIQNAVTWVWSTANSICKKEGIKLYYSDMLKEVKAAGYKRGDRLLLHSDKESQFRYDEPRGTPIRDAQSAPKKRTQPDPNNYWAKMFPVPDIIKRNETLKEGL